MNKILFCIFGILFFAHSLSALALETSETATVKAASLTVYSGMTGRSGVVKTLGKGDEVTVELEVSGSEGDWCGIREKGQSEISGFVKCEALERVKVQSRPNCHWTINAAFGGDASGSAVVRIPCNGGAAVISLSSNRGNYNDVQIKASGDASSVTMSGSGIYGNIGYSGIAGGDLKNETYNGSWKVKFTRETDRKSRDLSGNWRGIGNYNETCNNDRCR